MKIGTDSILLGVFVKCENVKTILDIGTGTGILALMMAQKSNAIIDAVEIDKNASLQAKQNFENSKWNERLNSFNSSIQQFKTDEIESYELIVSNPPFYRAQKNIAIKNEQRSTARHDTDLPFETLCDEVVNRLRIDGFFYLILPETEAQEFVQIAKNKKLFLVEKISIQPKPSKPAKRWIMCFSKLETEKPKYETCVLYNEDASPTNEYIERTKEFYLWTCQLIE